jgi:hypothetical protein
LERISDKKTDCCTEDFSFLFRRRYVEESSFHGLLKGVIMISDGCMFALLLLFKRYPGLQGFSSARSIAGGFCSPQWVDLFSCQSWFLGPCLQSEITREL